MKIGNLGDVFLLGVRCSCRAILVARDSTLREWGLTSPVAIDDRMYWLARRVPRSKDSTAQREDGVSSRRGNSPLASRWEAGAAPCSEILLAAGTF